MAAMAAVRGGELAYTREGTGTPLVCLHGGMGIDSTTLRVPGIAELARRGCEVVVFDQRGHGDSSAVAEQLYTHDLWASDVSDLVRYLGWDRFALLGHSYGGFIALEYAIRWPETLSHLVLVATSAGPVPMPRRVVTTDDELRDHFARTWPHLFAGAEKHWRVLEQSRVSASPFNAAFGRELPRYDLRSRVREITAPALLVVGRGDRYCADMEWLADELPNGSVQVLENVGHFPFIEAQESFVETVSRFLTGRAGEPGVGQPMPMA